MRLAHPVAVTSLTLAAALPLPEPLYAGTTLEEVVVVARKREESLQETPIAVTAVGEDLMRDAQINNLGDLSKHAPGLNRRDGDKVAHFSIRGIGVRSPQVDLEAGVGIYVDSIFIPRNDVQLVDIVEAQSVQVLRGPQGTLFGKNTAGGAILLTTKKPTEEFSGFVRANVGDLDRQKLRVGVSGPLIEDSLNGSIVVDRQKEDGYREDVNTGVDYGNTDRTSVFGQLQYLSDGGFSADLMAFWGDTDEYASPVTCDLVNTTASLQSFISSGQTMSYVNTCNLSYQLNDDEKVIMDIDPPRYKVESILGGLTLNWELDEFTIKSITGYLYQDGLEVGQDADGTDIFTTSNDRYYHEQYAANGFNVDEEREFVSQEFQFQGSAFDDAVDYTVGLFYSNETIDNSAEATMLGRGGFLGIDIGNGNVQVLPPGIAGLRDATLRNYENESAAIFGQAIVDLSDSWQLTLGGRYTWEEKTIEQTSISTITPSPGTISRAAFDMLQFGTLTLTENTAAFPNREGKDDWAETTYTTTLSYIIPDSWSGAGIDGGILYASYSTGFKAGGFSALGQSFTSFEPETLSTAELGYKLDMWDSRVRLNGAFYYTKYDDIQIRVTRTIPRVGLPPLTFSGVLNAGAANIKGAELELTVLPTDWLTLGANASYIDAEYEEFDDQNASGQVIDRSDEDFAFIPEVTWSVFAQFDWASDVGEVSARVDGSYQDETFIGLDAVAAAEPKAYLDDYTTWNFRTAFRPNAVEGFEVAAYVNNLTDEDYFGSGVATISGVGASILIPGKQRTYGVEVGYRW